MQLQTKLKVLEQKLKNKTDRVLSSHPITEMLIDFRKYQSAKINEYQQRVQLERLKAREEAKKEVESLFQEKRALN